MVHADLVGDGHVSAGTAETPDMNW